VLLARYQGTYTITQADIDAEVVNSSLTAKDPKKMT
jgi:hypothetical protein